MALVACDPELFLADKMGNPVSAIGRIGGSKKAPLPIMFGGLQEDNVAVEFNIDPVGTKQEFVRSVTSILAEIEKRAAAMDLSLLLDSTATFSDEQLAAPASWEIGCDPDFSAWSGRENSIHEFPGNYRSAGGHLHIDLPEYFEEVWVKQAVKAADLLIGVPLTALHYDGLRRNLYGKAGAYRPKPYGFEYRTPDNFWITDKSLMEFVFDRAQLVADNFSDVYKLAEEHQALIEAAINFGDIDAIEILLKLSE